MQLWKSLSLNRQAVLLAALMTASLHIYPVAILAQNPGSAPVFDKAVQGQQATQPEGTVLNIVNWIGNVISPLLAVGAVVMAVVSYTQGRGVVRWAVTAVGLLLISGLTRLIEAWINNGTAGVQ
jgi:hypothetical protein